MSVPLHPLAAGILALLGQEPAAKQLEIGGGVALWHYLPYRGTSDVDAWWLEETPEARAAVSRVVERVAAEHGLECVHRRQFGDERWDLKRAGKTVFAFQTAAKPERVEPPQASPWGSLQIESLRENLASKMGALVGRGAPRDILDVATLLERGLVSAAQCWELWEARPRPIDQATARCAVLQHLQGLERRRPLESIQEPELRARAAAARERIRDLCRGA